MSGDDNNPTIRFTVKELFDSFSKHQKALDKSFQGVPLERLKGVPDEIVELRADLRGYRRTLWMFAIIIGLALGHEGWINLFKSLFP